MTRIAVTGHRGMPQETERLVDHAIRAQLAPRADGLVGISCLADGADAIFARAVLDLGGALEAVVPAKEYRDGLPAEHHAEYDALLAAADRVHRSDRVESTAAAHMDASALMIEHADELLAVWDGQPARGHGGTADVVAHARRRHRPVRIVWPAGARRDR